MRSFPTDSEKAHSKCQERYFRRKYRKAAGAEDLNIFPFEEKLDALLEEKPKSKFRQWCYNIILGAAAISTVFVALRHIILFFQ